MAALPTAIEQMHRAVEDVGKPQFEKICFDVCKKGGTRLGSEPPYSMQDSTVSVDIAFFAWLDVKKLLLSLVMAQIDLRQIEQQFHKTKKRAAALENIFIPRYEAIVKQISAALEERERDEAIRYAFSTENA